MPASRKVVSLSLLAASLAPRAGEGQAHGSQATAEIFLGTAWSLPTPLTFAPAGEGERVEFRARYSTRPLRDAPYYSYRFGYGRDGRAVEGELVHHKLYLENTRPPIERFEVTHGYNLPVLNGVAPAGGWQLRMGLGLVIAHPEGVIAGRPVRARKRTWLGGGYHVAGGALQVAVGRRYPLGRGDWALTAGPEVKLTAAFARLRVEQGTLRVPNFAVHALGGLGVLRRT